MSALDDARALFTNAGLPFPEIPGEFTGEFHEVGTWHFEARAPKRYPYNIHEYVQAARRSHLTNYIVLAHAGHGVNSYAIHYFQVQKPLCVFLQIGWGGVYMDPDRSAETLERCFELVAKLTRVTGEARDHGRLGDDDRIIVTASEFYGSVVDVRRRGARKWRSTEYESAEKALEAATTLTTGLPTEDDPQTREKRRALDRLGDARARSFFRAARGDDGCPLAIQHVNEHLDGGESLEAILLSSEGAGYSLALKGRGRRFRIGFGWSDGRGLIGDGGEWVVEFDRDGNVVRLELESAWIS